MLKASRIVGIEGSERREGFGGRVDGRKWWERRRRRVSVTRRGRGVRCNEERKILRGDLA